MSEHDIEPEPSEPDKRKTLRRKEDRDRCAMCSFLWDNNDRDKKEHRELVCSKITKLETVHIADMKETRENFKNVVPWKAFLSVLTIVLALSGGINALVGSSVKDGQADLKQDLESRQEEVKRSLENIHNRISTGDRRQEEGLQLVNEKLSKIENSTSVLEWRMGQVEQKIGILKLK